MPTLRTLIPEADQIVAMATPDLAAYVLESLLSEGENGGSWHHKNFCLSVGRDYAPPRMGSSIEVGIACSTALSWLVSNGFICQHPDRDIGWFIATPRGRELRQHQQLQEVVASDQLPESFLHPDLLLHSRPLYFQGRYDTAVFEAFKSLEVAIRTAAGLGHDLVGVPLASRAFNPENGPLTDMNAEKGERVALMNLMTGALGSYKNPSSHRRVELSAVEAREMIVLASHLLRIVAERVRSEQ